MTMVEEAPAMIAFATSAEGVSDASAPTGNRSGLPPTATSS
jgi:hypothetical protein